MSNEYIRNAFKSLEDLKVVIEPVKTPLLQEDVEAEPIEDSSEKTVADLLTAAGSYLTTQEFDVDGTKYVMFMEGLHDGESCDILFDEFDISNVNEVLFEILDEEHDFIDSLHATEFGVDSKFSDVTKAAATQLNGEPGLEDDAEAEDEKEEHDKNVRDFVGDEAPAEDGKKLPPVEVEMEPANIEDAPVEESLDDNTEDWKYKLVINDYDLYVDEKEGLDEFEPENFYMEYPDDDIHLLTCDIGVDSDLFEWQDGKWVEIENFRESLDEAEGERKFIKTRNSCVDASDLADELEVQGIGYKFEDDGLSVEAKDYTKAMGILSNLESQCEESLDESQKFNLQDEQEVKKADEILNKDEGEAIEQIVDASAETIDDLQKTYIGSIILQCPTCKTMIYKNPDQLVKDAEAEEDIYNVDEECPHCGAKDGFELIGQVASLSVNPDGEPAPEEKPEEEPVEEPEEKPEPVSPMPELPKEEPAPEEHKTFGESLEEKKLKEWKAGYGRTLSDAVLKQDLYYLANDDFLHSGPFKTKEKAQQFVEYDDDRIVKVGVKENIAISKKKKTPKLEEKDNQAGQECFYEIIYMDADGEEKAERYECNEYDDARADYVNMANGNHGSYKYVVLRKVETNFSGEEEITEIDRTDDVKGIDESLKEDTVKKGKKWVNRGKEGEHGEFKTKKAADAQRKAMFANGYREDCKGKDCEVKLESFDEVKYDRLISRYLRESYSNVKAYKTTAADIDDGANKIIIEGVITFKSGKEKSTKFVFEAKEITKKNQIKFVGINEAFSPSRAYTLLGQIQNNKLVSESLSYRYNVDGKQVKGKIEPLRKR